MKKNQKKEGMPVNERYASVLVNGGVLRVVPQIIAGRLKRAGYNHKCSYYYDKDGELLRVSGVPMSNDEHGDGYCSAPYVYEAVEWLKNLGIIINVYNKAQRKNKDDGTYEYVATKECHRIVYVDKGGTLIQYKRPIFGFLNDVDAYDIAVREALNYLLKELGLIKKKEDGEQR